MATERRIVSSFGGELPTSRSGGMGGTTLLADSRKNMFALEDLDSQVKSS